MCRIITAYIIIKCTIFYLIYLEDTYNRLSKCCQLRSYTEWYKLYAIKTLTMQPSVTQCTVQWDTGGRCANGRIGPTRIVVEWRQFDWLFILNNQWKWRNSGTILPLGVSATAPCSICQFPSGRGSLWIQRQAKRCVRWWRRISSVRCHASWIGPRRTHMLPLSRPSPSTGEWDLHNLYIIEFSSYQIYWGTSVCLLE